MFHGWSAGGCGSAAPPVRPSVGPVPPAPAGPSDAEPGGAAGRRSPSLPRPAGPGNIAQHGTQAET